MNDNYFGAIFQEGGGDVKTQFFAKRFCLFVFYLKTLLYEKSLFCTDYYWNICFCGKKHSIWWKLIILIVFSLNMALEKFVKFLWIFRNRNSKCLNLIGKNTPFPAHSLYSSQSIEPKLFHSHYETPCIQYLIFVLYY